MFHNKKVIIVLAVIVVIGIGYAVFSSGNKPATTTGVTKQSVSQTTSGTTLQEGPGKEFVSQLLAIQNINFNLDFFDDLVFLGLKDFSQVIVEQPIGRPNPFAPFNDASRESSPTTAEQAISNAQNATTSRTTTGTRAR